MRSKLTILNTSYRKEPTNQTRPARINAPIRPDKRTRSAIENEADLARLFITGVPKPYELKTMSRTTIGANMLNKLHDPKFNELAVNMLVRI
tara:strand:- start:259 stop:534 length:276 start_codon:yes stop_codon:yes gene_type:complete